MNTLNLHRAGQLAARSIVVACATWATSFVLANAANPSADFDLGYMLECREVTTQAFARSHPHEKVLEAILRISVRLSRGDEQDIEQLLFEISNPTECLRVVDFVPRTRLESEAGNAIEVTKTTETIRSLGASAGSGVSISAGSGNAHGTLGTQFVPSANASANTTHRNELKETSKRIPPGKVVVASGTMDNEHGVFFRLKRSPTASFEGAKEVSFRFVVPADWRGDWVAVSAKALGRFKRSLFFKAVEPCGETKAIVALYLAGDAAAERAALEAAEAQELYLASQGDQERVNRVIAELSLSASPWRTARPRSAREPSRPAQPRICRKPGTVVGLIEAGGAGFASQRPSEGDPLEILKDALNRLAYFTAPAANSPGSHSRVSPAGSAALSAAPARLP